MLQMIVLRCSLGLYSQFKPKFSKAGESQDEFILMGSIPKSQGSWMLEQRIALFSFPEQLAQECDRNY